jgi:tetratricopeptide (TPR) repeat protein
MVRGHWLAVVVVLLLPVAHAAQATGSPDSFEELAARAGKALEADRVEDAVALYGRAVALRPQWSEGWWRLGTLLYDQGKFQQARDAFQHFTGVEKKAGAGFGMLGLCQFQLKLYPAALTALEEGIRLGLGPNREFLRLVLYRDATLNSLLGRPQAALARLTLLMDQNAAAHPGAAAADLLKDLETVDALGIAALRVPKLPGDVSPQKAALVRQAGRAQALFALEDLPAAAREFGQLADSYPQEPGVHYSYGVFLLKTNPSRALAEFQKEMAVSPADADARAQAAFECLRAGDFALGRSYAAEAVKLAPGNFAARVVLARLYLALDNPQQALEQAQVAVKLAPDSPDAHFALSNCYARTNRPEDAERERAVFQRLKEIADRSGQ